MITDKPYIFKHRTTRTRQEPGRNPAGTRQEPGRNPAGTRQEPGRNPPESNFFGTNAVSAPLFLFLIMAGRLFLKRAPNHAPNHKPPIQFQMLAAWYYISFFLAHGISLIEIGARFKNNLPAIIRNKKRGVRYCISAEKVRFGWVWVGSGRFRPGSGGFGWIRAGSGRFGWVRAGSGGFGRVRAGPGGSKYVRR